MEGPRLTYADPTADSRGESLVAQARRMAGPAAERPLSEEVQPGRVSARDGRVRRSPVQPLRGVRRRSPLPWILGGLALLGAAWAVLTAVL